MDARTAIEDHSESLRSNTRHWLKKEFGFLSWVTSPQNLFLLIAPVIFAAYALLTPPFQTFDESQHLDRAWQLSSLQLVGERRGTQSGGKLPPGLALATVKEIGSLVPQGHRRIVVRPISQIFSWNTPIGQNRPFVYYDFFGAALYSPVSYVPQIIATRIGESFGISVEWTLRLGRLLDCALCIGLIYWALIIMPFGRWLMTIIALVPPTAAAAASFGQDGLVIGASFLLTAFGLSVAARSRWSPASTSVVAVGGAVIALCKVVYLPLVAIAAIPKPTDLPWRRWISVPIIVSCFAALLLFAWMRLNSGAIAEPRPPFPGASEQASWMLEHPIEFSKILGQTYLAFLPFLWVRLYTFGDSTLPVGGTAALAGTAAILTMMVFGERNDAALNFQRRVWILVIFATVAVLIAMAIFLGNPRNLLYVRGIQGRYFLPILPLAVIALTRRRHPAPLLIPVALGLLTISHLFTLGTIVRTFYSF